MSQIKISYQTKGAAFPPPNQFGGFQAEELDEKLKMKNRATNIPFKHFAGEFRMGGSEPGAASDEKACAFYVCECVLHG